ncbi:hypothetical protein ABT275_33630 [Streptomyces sp. NPDC001185]
MSDADFQDRMFLAGQAVYEAIERGEVTDVAAALMDAHAAASEE